LDYCKSEHLPSAQWEGDTLVIDTIGVKIGPFGMLDVDLSG
jgi:hypothetical protein